MQPFSSSTMVASSWIKRELLISDASKFTSPMSFTITASRKGALPVASPAERRICFSSVVFPAPRKPESTVTGRRSLLRHQSSRARGPLVSARRSGCNQAALPPLLPGAVATCWSWDRSAARAMRAPCCCRRPRFCFAAAATAETAAMAAAALAPLAASVAPTTSGTAGRTHTTDEASGAARTGGTGTAKALAAKNWGVCSM
mmetsp:Transcript_89185/g.247669  ORF Transcript_89185/g.247669 Transcript_89185/m.247669 type:complete len:202 (+) Transcript_89185:1404-2009(+)